MLMRAAGYPLGAFAPGVPQRTAHGADALGRRGRVAHRLRVGRRLPVAPRARHDRGGARAGAAVALLAAYPFAVFFSAPYTESLFLLGAVAAIYHFRRGELVPAAAWGLLVGLTRPNGCFLSVVLALLIVERDSAISEISKFPNSQISKSLAAAAAPGVGMLASTAHTCIISPATWFGWARLHEAWGRSYSGLAPVERAYGWITDEGLLHVVEGVPFDTLNSLGLIFVLLMLWPVLRRLGRGLRGFRAGEPRSADARRGRPVDGAADRDAVSRCSWPSRRPSPPRRPTARHRFRDRPGTGGRRCFSRGGRYSNWSRLELAAGS